MTRYLTAIIICLSLYTIANAQTIIIGGRTTDLSIRIQVLDSLSKAVMPRAHVKVFSGGRDTTSIPTDNNGIAIYRGPFRADSVEFWVSHLGYETKRIVQPAPKIGYFSSTGNVPVYLVEKTSELAEIVVVGDVLAVVIKGDTVQFNAEAFKTFEGDPMSKLFELLPGMKLENGALSYFGETIQRITIDGTRLFGDNVTAALKNIRADDVENVKVYGEASDWDKLNEVDNPELNKVADVTTKSKPKRILNATLSASGGATIEPDDRGAKQAFYGVSGKLNYFRVGESASVNAHTGNIPSPFSVINTMDTGGGDLLFSLQPKYRTTEGGFNYNRNEVNKYSFTTNNTVGITKTGTESWSNRDYFLSDNWLSRNYNEQNSSESRSNRFSSGNGAGFTFKDKSVVGANVSFSYNGDLRESLNIVSAMQDGVQTQSRNIAEHNKNNSYNLNTRIDYRKKIQLLSISSNVSANISKNDGEGWRMDTLPSSTSQIHLDNNSGGWNRNYSGSVNANYSLTKTWTLRISENLSYIDNKSQRTSMDMLTGIVDTTNTYDYQVHEVNNNVGTGMSYNDNSKQKGIVIANVDMYWENKNMQRNEYFPRKYKFPRTFNVIKASAILRYKFSSVNTLQVTYYRGGTTVSILDFRDFLDDSNPVMLKAGNPYLKIPASNDLTVSGNFVKGPAAYEFKVMAGIDENTIVNKQRYFNADTRLPEYDYTALAGSSLITKENHNGQWRLNINGNYSVRSKKLLSNIRAGLSYAYNRRPDYVNEQLAMITTNRYGMSLSISGNFSANFTPSLTSNTDYSDDYNGYIHNQRLFQRLGVGVRGRIFKAIEVNASNDIRWDLRWPDVPDMDRFVFMSSLSLEYIFGKNKNFTLKAEGFDLFNKQQRITAITAADYIETSYRLTMGRYVMLKAEWRIGQSAPTKQDDRIVVIRYL